MIKNKNPFNMKIVKKKKSQFSYFIAKPLELPWFSLFLDISLFEDRVLHKGAWVAKLLGTRLTIQDKKKIKFLGLDISSTFCPTQKLRWIITKIKMNNYENHRNKYELLMKSKEKTLSND